MMVDETRWNSYRFTSKLRTNANTLSCPLQYREARIPAMMAAKVQATCEDSTISQPKAHRSTHILDGQLLEVVSVVVRVVALVVHVVERI